MKRILLVEDEADVRYFVRTVLEKENYQVGEAADGAGLRAALAGTAPALVILDLNLPDASGLSLLGELKEKWPNARVILLTGYGTVEIAEEAYKMDEQLFLHSKPVDADTLVALVEMALSLKTA